MSKKKGKGKSKGFKFYGDYYTGYDKKSKGKKGKKSPYKAPKLKDVKPTLSGKDGKRNRKLVQKPVEVPKELLKSRVRCNHADGIMSVADFKAMSPQAVAYTKVLDQMVAQFGEHVHICRRCLDGVVDSTEITADGLMRALVYAYAACNTAVSGLKMKEDEVKSINKLKKIIDDFAPVLEILRKMEEARENGDGDGAPSGGAGLNKNPSQLLLRN